MADSRLSLRIDNLQRAVNNDEVAVALAVGDLIPAADRPAAGRDVVEALWRALESDAPETTGASPREGVLAWFRDRGFGTVPVGAQTFAHSHLPSVVETSQGLPIAVAVVLAEGLRRCGIEARGINYPGHFLLRCETELIDPLTLESVSPDTLSNDPRSFSVATTAILGMRMINNLKALHLQSGAWHEVLDLIEVQLALVDESDGEALATLHYERAELWQRLGAPAIARQALLDCLAGAPPPKLAAVARGVLDKLSAAGNGNGPQTFH